MIENHVCDRAYQDKGESDHKEKFAERLSKQKHPHKDTDKGIEIDIGEQLLNCLFIHDIKSLLNPLTSWVKEFAGRFSG